MKNNTFKRVMAGSLALLTVAAPMSANVGGILQEVAIVASADQVASHTLTWTDIGKYLTSIAVAGNNPVQSTTTYSSGSFTEGEATVVSTIPLTISTIATPYNTAATGAAKDTEDAQYEAGARYKLTKSGDTYTYKFVLKANVTLSVVEVDVAIDNTPNTAIGEAVTAGNRVNVADFTVVKGDGATTVVAETGTTAAAADYDWGRMTTQKIISSDPFVAYMFDGTNYTPVKSNYDTTSATTAATYGKYVAEVTIPDVDATAANAPVPAYPQIFLQKVVEKVTYTADGAKLIANSDGISNGVVAELKASYVALDATTVNMASGDTAANGRTVNFKLTGVEKYLTANNTSYGLLTIKKDGTALAGYNNKSLAAGELNAGIAVNFMDAGTYTATCVLYVTENGAALATAKEINFTFKIAAKADLTAESVELTPASGAAGFAPTAVRGVTDKVVEVKVPADYDGKDAVTVTPAVKEYGEDGTTVNATLTVNTDYTVSGTTSSSVVGDTNIITIAVTNAEYGGTTASPKYIVVKWKLVKETGAKGYTWAVNSIYGAPNNKLTVSMDEIDNQKAKIFNNINLVNVEEKDITFEYQEGLGGDIADDDLDERSTGLPSKVGEYTVYFICDGEAFATMDVEVIENSIKANIPTKQLTKSFGDKLEFTGVTYKDVNGKTVSNVEFNEGFGLVAQVNEVVYKKDPKTGQNTTTIDTMDDGSYKLGTLITNTDKIALAPGQYVVTVGANDATKDEKWTLVPQQYIVTVEKRAITADMITVAAMEYTGNSQTVEVAENYGNTTAKQITAKYTDAFKTDHVFLVRITSGTNVAKAAGTYSVTLAPATAATTIDKDGEGDFDAKASDYIDGSVAVDWHIVTVGTTLNGLKFDTTKTTLLDAGRIHFEVNRPSDSSIAGTIKRFGIVLDKTGKIAAPAAATHVATNAEITAAKAVLQVGNGLVEGEQGDLQKKNTPTKYGVNIKCVDVETGIWARPYIETTDGKIYYGEPVYRNLQDEATQKLQLKLANDGTLVSNSATSYKDAVTKADLVAQELKKPSNKKTEAQLNEDLTGNAGIQSGYIKSLNKYYVYASFQKFDASVEADIKDFGVVVDKKGTFSAPKQVVGQNNGVATGFLADNKTTVADGLKLGKGYIEGQYNPNNNVLSAQEYGARITPQDTVTGVWVRAYIKLSDTLVVYSDPVYIESVSALYTTAPQVQKQFVAGTDAVAANNTELTVTGVNVLKTGLQLDGKAHYEFEVPVATATGIANPNKLTFKAAGVVVDKTGSFLTYNSGTKKYTFDKAAKANSELLVGKGFVEGKKTTLKVDANTDTKYYAANVTPNLNNLQRAIPVVARPYTIYTTTEGVDVVVYGSAYAVQTTDSSLTAAGRGA